MRILAALAVAVVALCACNAQNSVPTGPQSEVMPARPFGALREAGGKAGKRLFVSDAGTGEIYVYEIPSLKLVAILQGFAQPRGECADGKGNVFAVDGSTDIIYKLSYAGRTENRLNDTTGTPDGCAWDPKNADLAVFNVVGTQSKPGAVLIYHHGAGSPKTYGNPKQYYYEFGGYDGAGNLFFDGSDASGKFMLSELPVKGSTAQTIAVSGAKIYGPGMVQWDPDSSYLDVGDQNCGSTATSCLYQMSVSGTHATVKNTIALRSYTGSEICDLVQGVIAYGELFGSDFDYCGYARSATYGWGYPAGGNPKKTYKKNVSQPIGAAIAVSGSQASLPRQTEPWMDLKAKNLDLLYIANADGTVIVYTYWQKTLVGQLTGFNSPQGECVDKNNNVYITDAGNEDIVEYAHAGKKPLRTIDDSPYVPVACAVDVTTGNLAVANESGGSSGEGNVAVYANASGTPTIYTNSSIQSFKACVYDNRGNLLATNGQSNSSRYSYFAWLPKGGKQLTNITVPGPGKSWVWEDVQGLQWDGRYYVIDFYGLYRIAIRSGEAYFIGSTSINETDVWGPYWIYSSNPKKQGTQFVGASHNTNYPAIEYFNYPAGGDAIAYISKDISSPTGLTVSLAKIHQ